jgi:hypothetical protein
LYLPTIFIHEVSDVSLIIVLYNGIVKSVRV